MEADFVAHGGASSSESFIQTLVLTDVATGWTKCVPVLLRESALVIDALRIAEGLFPFALRGIDFDNGSAFMNELVVAWCRQRGLEVTWSRAYKKNDQAIVEQKNGALVRRHVGYGRFEGMTALQALSGLYAAVRLQANLLQPSFKLKEKTRVNARDQDILSSGLTGHEAARACRDRRGDQVRGHCDGLSARSRGRPSSDPRRSGRARAPVGERWTVRGSGRADPGRPGGIRAWPPNRLAGRRAAADSSPSLSADKAGADEARAADAGQRLICIKSAADRFLLANSRCGAPITQWACTRWRAHPPFRARGAARLKVPASRRRLGNLGRRSRNMHPGPGLI